MEAFQNAIYNIKIEDADFTYKVGKGWEQSLQSTKDQTNRAFGWLESAKKRPNSMFSSLALYVVLSELVANGTDFARVEQFENTLNGAHYDLSFWCVAFEKAHLSILALNKDNKTILYPTGD